MRVYVTMHGRRRIELALHWKWNGDSSAQSCNQPAGFLSCVEGKSLVGSQHSPYQRPQHVALHPSTKFTSKRELACRKYTIEPRSIGTRFTIAAKNRICRASKIANKTFAYRRCAIFYTEIQKYVA
jgi:hypothetical protein